MRNPLTRVRQRGLGVKIALLAAVTVLVLAAVAPLAYHFADGLGVGAAAIAGLMCLLPAICALVVSSTLRGPENALPGLLLAMLIRTGMPLLFALLLVRSRPLVNAGAVYYLVLFYLVALGLETWLSLPVSMPRSALPEPRRDTVA